jgi:CheY-like chemotaxis protein
MAHASEKRILVVDDEPDVRNFLATCIEDAGFNVEVAVDGVDALEKVAKDAPDLMTLDMVMPRKSGVKVLRTLRENKEWENIPVIVITAHARDEFGSEDIKILSAFTSRHRPRYTMEKPVTPKKLIDAIGEILDVEVDDTTSYTKPLSNKNASLAEMIKKSDPGTIDKIKNLLRNKQ